MRIVSALLIRGRGAYLLCLLAAASFFAVHAARLEVDRDNSSMNAVAQSRLHAYREFTRSFGSAQDYLLAVSPPALLSASGLAFLDDLTSRISRLPGVASADSLTTAVQAVAGPAGASEAPLISPEDRRSPSSKSIERSLARNSYLDGLLISADRKTAGIVIRPDAAGIANPDDLIAALRGLVAKEREGAAELHLTGVALQKHDVAALVRRDQRVLVPVCLTVFAAALALCFRSLWGVLLPLAVTVAALVTTAGCYQLAGLSLNPISSLLPAAVTVVSISTSVHLYHGWQQALRDCGGKPDLQTLLALIRSLAPPCFLAAITTAFGFASLALSDTPAVRYFGVFAALGVMVSFAVAMTLIPVALSFLYLGRRAAGREEVAAEAGASEAESAVLRGASEAGSAVLRGASEAEGAALPGASETEIVAWRGASEAGSAAQAGAGFLRAIVRLSCGRPRTLLSVAGLLTLVMAAGIPLVRNNTDLVRFLHSSEPLYRDTMFIDRHLSGPNNIDLSISRRDGAVLGAADLGRVFDFTAACKALPQVTSALGIAALIEQVHRAENANESLPFPDRDDDIAAYLELLELGDRSDLLHSLIDAEHRTLRLRLSVHAIGSSAASKLIDKIGGLAREIMGAPYDVVPSGAFYQVVTDSDVLVRSQLLSFAAAFALVFSLIGLLFRSRRLILACIVANLPPVLWTAGAMGYTGVELSSGTVMIASVVIGIVVDDTIHYLLRFLRERRYGERRAIERTTLAVGAPLVVSSLVLAMGFWVGCLGSFRPTFYFSLLSGVTMLTALACDLLLLPAFLLVTSSDEETTCAEVR